MAITLQVEDVEFESFVSIAATITLDTMSGSFTFESRIVDDNNFPIKVGQEATVKVDGNTVNTGFIEVIQVTSDADEHVISIEGRDRTSDVIDNTFGTGLSFQTDILLEDLIRAVLIDLGIPGIKVINNVTGLTAFTSAEIEKPTTGQSGFDFLEESARKKQVFLITDGLGNIVISRSEGTPVTDFLINDPDNTSSNILRSTVRYDNSNRFNKYILKSQENVAAASIFGASLTPSNIVDKENSAIDSDIRSSRTLTIQPEKSYSIEQLQQRAEWEANIRRIQSRVYTATVQGHTQPSSNDIWRPNQLVQIKDVFADIDEELLSNTVEFNLSVEEGSTTTISFVDKDAYQVQAEVPILQKKSNSAKGLFSL